MSSKNKKLLSLEDKLNKVNLAVDKYLGKQKSNVLIIRSKDELKEYVDKCIENGVISIDTETNNSLDPVNCKLMGLCLYSNGLKGAYVPVNHINRNTGERLEKQLTEEDIREVLTKVNENNTYVLMHNGKFDYEVIKCTCGIEIIPNWDTMIAALLLDENKSAKLKDQYHELDKNQSSYKIDDIFEDIEYALLDPEVFGIYAAVDALITYKLYEHQKKLMEKEPKIKKLFEEVEMPIVVIAAEMELLGARVDEEYCEKLKEKYLNKLVVIDNKIYEEINKLSKVISDWKKSPKGLELEIIYITENDKKKLTFEEIERRYPRTDDRSGERYKIGKVKKDLLSDPIKLTSPKQLMILFYEVFGASPVKSKNSKGTGSTELELLIEDFTDVKDLIKKYLEVVNLLDSTEDKDELKKIKKVISKFNRIRNQMDSIVSVETKEDIESSYDKINTIINILKLILERRGIDKLITTYLNVVPSLANHWDDNKIRFQLKTLGTKTGRFSSGGKWKFLEDGEPVLISGMNAQNIPSKNHEIRLLFRADEGRVFIGGDFSTQEPKMTAYLARDKKMLKVFEEGKDIYASIAQSIFGTKYEENLEFFDKEKTQINWDGKERRSVGKTIIIATMYGMGVSTVASRIGKSREDAQVVLDSFYSDYPNVKKLMDGSIKLCKTFGYVEDIYGRKRRLPNIQLPLYKAKFNNKVVGTNLEAETLLRYYLNRLNNDKLSKEEIEIIINEAKKNNIIIESNELAINRAERQCLNARIQGSAATLTKKTMVMLYNDEEIKKLDAHIVFQIHDELILECPIENAQKVVERLKFWMENSVNTLNITIPMKCDIVVEDRWGLEAMTSEIRVAYEKLVKDGVENPLEELYKEFSNFPSESLKRVIEGTDKVLTFEFPKREKKPVQKTNVIVKEPIKPIEESVKKKVKETKVKVKKPKKEKINLTYKVLINELSSKGSFSTEINYDEYTFVLVGENIEVKVIRLDGTKSFYKIPIDFKNDEIDLESDGDLQNKLLKVIFNKVSLPDEEAIEERVIKSRLTKQFKKAIEEGIVIVEEDEEVINEEQQNQVISKDQVKSSLVLSEEVKRLIIKENNEFKEEQYGSLSKEERKKLAAFYTPGVIAIKLIEELSDLSGNVLDPTCGSGNLLAAALIAGADSDKIFGNEINPEMVELCRKRLNKVCDMLGKPHIRDWQIHVGNALSSEALTQFGPEYCEAQENELREFGVRHTGFIINDKDREKYRGKPKELKKYLEKYGLYDLPSVLKDED